MPARKKDTKITKYLLDIEDKIKDKDIDFLVLDILDNKLILTTHFKYTGKRDTKTYKI